MREIWKLDIILWAIGIICVSSYWFAGAYPELSSIGVILGVPALVLALGTFGIGLFTEEEYTISHNGIGDKK